MAAVSTQENDRPYFIFISPFDPTAGLRPKEGVPGAVEPLLH